jgi:hypothetical protein
MTCPACETVNSEGAERCSACGQVLLRASRDRGRGRALAVVIVVLVLGCVAVLVATQCGSSYHP